MSFYPDFTDEEKADRLRALREEMGTVLFSCGS